MLRRREANATSYVSDYLTRSVRRASGFVLARQIGIGAAVTRRPLPHHRAYGSVHGGSSWLR